MNYIELFSFNFPPVSEAFLGLIRSFISNLKKFIQRKILIDISDIYI